METQELRLKLVEVILTNVKGLAPVAVMDVAKQYEGYINGEIPNPKGKEVAISEPSISDKAQAPDDSQKEGRTGSDEPSKKKPR